MNSRIALTRDIELGEALFSRGKLEESKNYFLTLLKKFPDNAQILNNVGVIFYEQGNVDDAEQYFLGALASQPDYVESLLNLADLYQNQKRWKEAANQLEKYTRIVENDYSVFNQLGLDYLKMGDTVLAQEVLEKSLKLNLEQREVEDSLRILKGSKNENSVQNASPSTTVCRQKQPVVSVGLPVYNGGNILSQAIEAILSQEFSNIELIISDNCSSDDTAEICSKYQRMDERVKYCRLDENVGALKNFSNALGLSGAPYFMWISHDDLRERLFISKCLERIESDPLIALVYPKTKVLDANSMVLGIANDHVNTDQDNPVQRFRHLIWEVGMCNMVYGLYRTNIVKKTRTWGKSLFWDNLFLAEVALMGKIVQIDDVLFVRRLTNNYNYASLDERYGPLISQIDHNLFKDGITLPHCRLTYAHLELVNYSELQESEKNILMKDILKCFRTRFGTKMEYEINRAVTLINNGCFYCTWNDKQPDVHYLDQIETIDYFRTTNLLNNLREAVFIYPERKDLKNAYELCLERASKFKFE
ncbi:MAG: glycosyltransferase [Deltaproteobacteria bacterium]|nr:glycosyltransferase [Deltaproteobacteria bacterium]